MTTASIIDKIDAAASISKAPADILTSHDFRRLKHESQSQWKERILSIDSTANFIKEDNTIALATSFKKANRKAKRQQAKEGTKKKGSKNRNSLTYNILNRQATERQSQEAAMAISLQDRLAAYQNREGTDEVVTDDDEKDDKDSCCCIPQSCVTRATILIKLHQQVDQKKIDTSTTTKITTTQTGSLLRKNSKGKEAAVSMSLSERLAAYQKQGGGLCEDDHTISTSSSMSYEPSSQESSGSDIKERMAKLQRCNSSINDHPMLKQRKHDDPKEAAVSSMSLKDRLEAYQNHQVNIDEEKKTTQQTILQHETSQKSSAQQQQHTKIESTTNNIFCYKVVLKRSMRLHRYR